MTTGYGAAKSVVMVLGMHRSGTSAVTRVLNLLGVGLGSDLLQPQDDNNKGFWEHAQAVDIHERLLGALGRNWHDVREMPAGWLEHPAVEVAIGEIMALVSSELELADVWAVKDPRMCRLAPLWLTALDRLGVQARAVLVVRDPREVAMSLHRRDGWTLGHAYLMWIQHFVEALEATRAVPRAIVSYTQLLDDWRQVMEGVESELALQGPWDFPAAATDIDAFIAPGDRHQRADAAVLPPELLAAPLPSLLGSLYRTALAVAAGEHAWGALEKGSAAYKTASSVFSLPLRDLVDDRNKLEQVAIERMDNIHGLVVAKENIEQSERELRDAYDQQSIQLRQSQAELQLQEAHQAGLAVELKERKQDVGNLLLDQRELLTIRDALERERIFVERAFEVSDRLESELRTKLLAVESDAVRLREEHARIREEHAAIAAAHAAVQQAHREAELGRNGAAAWNAQFESQLQEHIGELVSRWDVSQARAVELQALQVNLQACSANLQIRDAELRACSVELQSREVALQVSNAELQARDDALQASNSEREAAAGEIARLLEINERLADEKLQLEQRLIHKVAALAEMKRTNEGLAALVENGVRSRAQLESDLHETKLAYSTVQQKLHETDGHLQLMLLQVESRRWLLRKIFGRK